jgi:signal transduction histidine kinase
MNSSATPNVGPQLATELVDLLDGTLTIQDFVATVVHEAAQPLAAIQVLATALRTAGDSMPADQRTEMLIEIESQAMFLRDLSSWMLTPFGRETVLFDDLVSDAAMHSRPLAPDHSITTAPGADALFVTCETVRVEASIRNLIKNSAANSEPGSEIVVSTLAQDGLAIVRVSDAGVGIPEAEWERIFHPYARLQGERTPASGLGLFIVRSCASTHGGHAKVLTSSSQGTTMELALRALTPADAVA